MTDWEASIQRIKYLLSKGRHMEAQKVCGEVTEKYGCDIQVIWDAVEKAIWPDRIWSDGPGPDDKIN